MRRRLLGSIAGAIMGFCLGSLLHPDLNLSPALASVACSVAGMAGGYVVSMLADVFFPTPH